MVRVSGQNLGQLGIFFAGLVGFAKAKPFFVNGQPCHIFPPVFCKLLATSLVKTPYLTVSAMLIIVLVVTVI